MKSHNTDYLSNEALSWHPRLGIHAANIAPEFGVVETKKILEIMDDLKLDFLKKSFIKISLASKKWKKWMLKDTKASDYDRAVISGHYIFSNAKFIEIKKELSKILKIKKKLSLDKILKEELKISITRYLSSFNLID
jgi:hypothetical protein